MLLAAGLTERHARALLRLRSEEERKAAIEYISANKLTANLADEYIASLLSKRQKTTESANRKEQYVIRDMRLFCNTVDRALKTMRRAGFRADLEKEEDDTSVTFEIKIFK